MKNDNFEQSHSAVNSEKGDPLGFSNIYYVPKHEKIEGGPFGTMGRNFRKKVL